MSWIAVGAGAVSVGTGVLSAYSANKSNKRRPTYDFKPYSGLKPPPIDTPEYQSFRPVQQQITDILMRRSQGQDVGYDPARRDALLKSYDLGRKKDLERSKADINDRLSGMGLSRNLKAVDALYNRAMEDYQTSKDKYVTDVDIEDLTRANEERDVNTARLQNLNTFNFGQENNRANFDLDVYDAENRDRARAYGSQMDRFQNYRDPLGEGVNTAISTFGQLYGGVGGKSGGGGGSGALASNVRPSDALYRGSNNGLNSSYQDIYNSPRLRYSRYLGGN